MRDAVLLASALVGCGGGATPPPAEPAPLQPVDAAIVAALGFELVGHAWQILVDGGAVTPLGEDEVEIATATFTLDLQDWPRTDDFRQTLAGVKEGMAEPDAPILHEVDGGEGVYELVLDVEDGIRGAVLRQGHDTGAMCMFDVADGGDWQTPLAACQSVEPN